MSAVIEREAIGALFNSQWAGRTAIAWPNMTLTPEPTQSYVKFSIVQGNADDLEVGSVSQKRATGRVFIQVFVPEGSGDHGARVLCDAAVAAFTGANRVLTTTDGRILFRQPTVRDIGASKPHYQYNVSIPYLYDTL